MGTQRIRHYITSERRGKGRSPRAAVGEEGNRALLTEGLFSIINYIRASSLRTSPPHLLTKVPSRQLSFGEEMGGQSYAQLHTCCWECRSVSRYLITWFLKSLDFSFYRRQDSTLTSQSGRCCFLPTLVGWWCLLLTKVKYSFGK